MFPKGCLLKEASEQSSHFGNKSFVLWLFALYLVNVYYVYANFGLSVLQVVLEHFLGPNFFFLVTKIWGKS